MYNDEIKKEEEKEKKKNKKELMIKENEENEEEEEEEEIQAMNRSQSGGNRKKLPIKPPPSNPLPSTSSSSINNDNKSNHGTPTKQQHIKAQTVMSSQFGNNKPLRSSRAPPPPFKIHDIVNQNQIEITYPISSYIMQRQKKVVPSQSLQKKDIVLKEGWLQKKNKYGDSWRARWCVIDEKNISIFKTQDSFNSPTRSIPLCSIINVVSEKPTDNTSKTMFYIQTKHRKYYFQTDIECEKTKYKWVDIINKYRHKCIKISVFIECDRDIAFNDNFKFIIPYNDAYSYRIKDLIDDIMYYVQQKHLPLKIISTKIKQRSFARKAIDDSDCKDLETKITDYPEEHIEDFGVCLEIDIYHKNLNKKEQIIYFELFKKKYKRDEENRQNYWEILSSVTQQIIKKNAKFIISDPENLHFIFINHLLTVNDEQEIQSIVHKLDIDELDEWLKTIKDKDIERLIFNKKREQMLTHYNMHDLMILLNKYYSDSLANFVFERFKPSFSKSMLWQRQKFIRMVSIKMLIKVYKHNNIGQHLHIDELKIFFNRFRRSQQCWGILSAVTEQIIEKNVVFITSDANNLHFVFLNQLVRKNQIHIIVSKLTANALSDLINYINDENTSKYIFEIENKQILSHYNDNDLIMLLRKHYSYSFAIFVFERFDTFSKLQRTEYLKAICIEMMIWIMNQKHVGNIKVSEISIFVDKIKNSICDNQRNICDNFICSQLTTKIIIEHTDWIKEIGTDSLQLFVVSDLVSKSEIVVIINELVKRQEIYQKQCEELLKKNRMIEMQNKQFKANIIELKNDHSKQMALLNERVNEEIKQLKNKHSKKIEELQSTKSFGYTTIWQWCDYETQWKPYDHETNQLIENLGINENYTFLCAVNKQKYRITKLSKERGMQINTATKVSREIRQQKIQTALNGVEYPKWWNMSNLNNNASYAKPKLTEMNLNVYPGKSVHDLFRKTVNGYKVIKVESVENQMLFDAYWVSGNKLLKLVGKQNVNERKLFHGTGNEEVMKSVEREGFRKEFNKTSMYGKGTYFARDASYSINYSSNNNGVYKMFSCQVFCGESVVGKPSYKLTTWPKKNNGTGLIYDSLVDKQNNPSIFVIHDDVRAYPMFVIHFTKN